MESFIKYIGVFVLGLVLVFIACLLTGWVVMLLWNWLVPIVFAKAVATGWIAGSISYWEGWGLAMLGSCLFGKNSSGPSSKS